MANTRLVKIASPFLLLCLLIGLGCGGKTPRPRQAGLTSPGLQPLSPSLPAPQPPERLTLVEGISLCAPLDKEPSEQERALYAHISLLLVPEPKGDLVRALRKHFPQATILLLRDLRPSGDYAVLSAAEADEAWLLPEAAGPVGVLAAAPAERHYDLASSAARQALSAALVAQLQDSSADGLYLRGLQIVAAPTSADQEVQDSQNRAVQGGRELIAATRESASRAPIIPEADLADSERLQPLLAEADGLALRVPVGWDDKAGSKWLSGLWTGLREAAARLANAKRGLLLVPTWPTDKSGKPQQTEDAVRQLVALYLLAWSERARLCLEPALVASAGLDCALRLGTAGKTQEKDGLVSRKFEGACVFLNLADKEAALPAAEGMVTLAGEGPPTSLAARAALILVKAPEEPEEKAASDAHE